MQQIILFGASEIVEFHSTHDSEYDVVGITSPADAGCTPVAGLLAGPTVPPGKRTPPTSLNPNA
jgi:hypothetical protein